jgi:hypothetical protein
MYRNLLPLAVAIASASCGPKNGGLSTAKAWDPDYAEYFDDSVDFTMNPDSLSGQWMYSYKIELEGRTSLSDYIVALRVHSVSVQMDTDDRQLKLLSGEVEKNVKGAYPGDTVVLEVADDQPGFDSFDEEDVRLTDKVFVAFLRLYKKKDKSVGIHWHLSPLSQGLMKGLEDLRKQEKQEKREEKKGKGKEKTYTVEH